METFKALVILATFLAAALVIGVVAAYRREARKRRAAPGEPAAFPEIKPGTNRSIKELGKHDFQFIDPDADDSLFIYSRIALLNPVNVKIVVQNGGALLFYGTTTEDILVNPGGSAVIYGTVVGAVINNGGEIHIYGRIIGPLTRNAGSTQVYHTAQVLEEASPESP